MIHRAILCMKRSKSRKGRIIILMDHLNHPGMRCRGIPCLGGSGGEVDSPTWAIISSIRFNLNPFSLFDR